MRIHQSQAMREARNLVENTADEFVRGELKWDAQMLAAEGCVGLIVHAVRRRLETLYSLTITDPEKRAKFVECIDHRIAATRPELLVDAIKADGVADHVSWAEWLCLYRALLRELSVLLGMPGDIEPSDVGVVDIKKLSI